MRFGELRRLHTKLSEKMLARQLKELEADQLITRTVYNQIPPKVEYALTATGKTLAPILMNISAWSQDYLESVAISIID